MADPFNLNRFIDAQAAVYDDVLAELRDGRKHSHWIWFIFPQMKGLGRSPQAQHFGIGSLGEARAYLNDPVLGPRLEECTRLVNRVEGRSIHEIFGTPDDMKFRSSMTLFSRAAEDSTAFNEALRKYFDAVPDAMTAELLDNR